MMAAHQQIGIAPAPALMAILSRFDRPTLEAFLSVAVDLLDTLDPDPDAEQSTWLEAIEAREHDAGLPEDSEAGGDEQDAAYIEWHTKPANRRKGRSETIEGEEDDETVSAEDEFHPNGGSFALGRGWPAGCGCPISDPDVGIDERPHDGIDEDREHEADCHPTYGIDQAKGPLPPTITPDHVALRKHLNRIRETRCEKFTYRNPYTQRVTVEFRLKD